MALVKIHFYPRTLAFEERHFGGRRLKGAATPQAVGSEESEEIPASVPELGPEPLRATAVVGALHEARHLRGVPDALEAVYTMEAMR